ncbi:MULTISPECIES: bifunctional cytidylyltransferase/SDR family oxidoreductase [Actinomadura]|uniref:2-C-methyl-D-erythritol 4-phosphate cytidylyltransferase n=1 Tax=Actinomadura madurae TaxID=1993 RepID=A0A1I5TS24_9ACTN|nr:bifunctional cytidylyltransferase/SDR family oxidoreductase [Actinomadura madurae]SFP85872.1 2-C-methyl-D-erythritol 4-phosphate cytidylyltransferase [Actinomadura madurae]SPT51623.1 Putative 2-C-methyl-D-erythritol 4-phosphate cytidylyltransferase 2 [Actinomadura madurae]
MVKASQGEHRIVAVVLAGGSGQRMGLSTPKQLLRIAGKTILEHTLGVFEEAPDIDEILVLMNPGFLQDAAECVRKAGCTKVTAVLPGGTSRNATTQLALDALADHPGETTSVLFHDAVRPLLSQRIIHDCVTALREHRAVDVAIPSADTIIQVEDDVIVDVPRRSNLRRGQTPQGFRLATIRAAYEKAWRDEAFEATDDCSVVLRYLPGTPIHVVPGDEHNMKVTAPVDMFVADKLFQLASSDAPDLSEEEYAGALAGKTMVVFGASQGIGAAVSELARGYGARVFGYSRGTTRTHVERPDDVAAALAQAYGATGRVDHVVNTAGVLRIGRLDTIGSEAVEEALRVNYLAPIHIARAAFPYLAKTGGRLLLYTSSSYTRGRADYSLYSSAKAATVNLTQALADEWSADGVLINCINPERTSTPMRTAAFGQEPPHTLLSADQVARTSLNVLLSGLTGQVVDVRREDPLAAVRAG